MISRIIIVLLSTILVLPVSLLTPPVHPGGSLWSAQNVEAKKRHRKRKPCKPKANPPTPGRQSLTQTFLTSDPTAIPGAPGATKGLAAPYPSAIDVSGFTNGAIKDVDLLLLDVSHAVPEDIDILLSAPDGQRALVMSDTGRIFSVTNIDLTLDDEATAAIPESEALHSGAFRPTDIPVGGPDDFGAPAPAFDGSIALSTFNGGDPNGAWQLWVMDDASGDTGTLGGWALRITAEVDAAQTTAQGSNAKPKPKHAIKAEKKRKKCKR